MPPRGSGKCWPQVLRERIYQLREAADPDRLPRLENYLKALESSQHPRSTLKWINTCPGFPILEQLVRGEIELTHQALDDLEAQPTNAVTFLRPALVTHGALPLRDEQLARLQRWITTRLAVIPEGEDRGHLRAFAHWHVLHRLEHRYRDAPTPAGAAHFARRRINRAIDLIQWLHQRDQQLADLRQDAFDQFLCDTASTRNGIEAFVQFTNDSGITPALQTPIRTTRDHTRPLPQQTRHELIARLLADETLDPRDRFAGCLLMLYAQPVARIAELRTQDLDIDHEHVTLRIGRNAVALPEPLARLARQLADTDHGQTLSAATKPSSWLIRGNRVEQPINNEVLAKRLRRLGIRSEPSRIAALSELLHRAPATIVAAQLGYSPWIAQKWSWRSATYYARYIAQRSP